MHITGSFSSRRSTVGYGAVFRAGGFEFDSQVWAKILGTSIIQYLRKWSVISHVVSCGCKYEV